MLEENKLSSQKYLYSIFCLLLLVGVVPAFHVLLPNNTAGIIYKIFLFLVFLFSIDKILKINKYAIYYLLTMLLGALLHLGMDLQVPILYDLFRWTMPIVLLSIGYKYGYYNRVFSFVILCFFALECTIAIYEKLTSSFVIQYVANDFFDQDAAINADFSDFRSASLLRHPLNNANFISLFLGFVFCSKSLKIIWKYGLICLGLIALWCVNSRGAMLCWMFLIVYRMFFYKISIMKMIMICVVLFLSIDPIMSFLYTTDSFGRLNFDFSDDSTLTRLLSYTFFWEERWNFEKIVAGGTIIYMPGTNLTLENGVLVTLGYWGWIVGLLKVVLEFVLTYICLYKYDIREKFIILVSFWGVAFMNNNSFYPLMLSLFVITYVTFNSYSNIEIKKT